MNPLLAYRAGVTCDELKLMTHEEIQTAIAEQTARRQQKHDAWKRKNAAINLELHLNCAKTEHVERFARWLGLDATKHTNEQIAEEAWK
jgi:hypothetical protein